MAHVDHVAALFVDGEHVDSQLVTMNLEPGERWEGCFGHVWACTPPEDAIAVWADWEFNVPEGDEENNARLLREMEDKANRAAAFICVISIAVPSGLALTYEARCEGLIAEGPAGKSGFGYDPVFYYPPLNRTFAQLSAEEKNRVSHRGKALAELKEEFEKVLVWIRQRL